ncbi:putative Ig domain-containing protein [Methylomagnum sp.]
MNHSNHRTLRVWQATAVGSRKKLAALPLALLGMAGAGDALARSGYSNDVAAWCANAGRPAPTPSLLNCDTCHGNKTPFRNLRNAPANPTYLNYFCKAAATPTNKAPVVSVAASANAVEGKLLRLTVGATDPDKNAVTLAASNLPQGASFNAATGQFGWTPDIGTAAVTPTVIVNFAATDQPTNGTAPLTSRASVTIQVAATSATVNNPPVIAPIADQNAYVGTPLSFKVTASDKDGDTITLSAAGQPLSLGGSFDPSTGLFTWTPTAAQVSTPSAPYLLTVTATDDFGTPASTTETVSISVNAAGGGDASITRLLVQKAAWNNKAGKLSVAGKLGLTKGKAPAGLAVNVWDGDTSALLGSANVNKNGGWTFMGDLGQDASPCSVRVEINGLAASKKVARSGCGSSTSTGGSRGGDDDGGRENEGHDQKSERGERHGRDDDGRENEGHDQKSERGERHGRHD